MPTSVDRDTVRRLVEAGAQLAEVLPSKEYKEGHLPGALHIPLRRLSRETTAHLARDRPIIVYCHDAQ